MRKKSTILLISLASVLVAAPGLAAPPETSQVVAMMGTQPAPVIVDDLTIQKAIEALVKQQKQRHVDIRKKIPERLDNPLGEQPLKDNKKVLILGGPDVVPM
jgi:hypothetical protein